MTQAQICLQPEGTEMPHDRVPCGPALYLLVLKEPRLCIGTRASPLTFPSRALFLHGDPHLLTEVMRIPLRAAELHTCAHAATVWCFSPLHHSADTLGTVKKHTQVIPSTHSPSARIPKYFPNARRRFLWSVWVSKVRKYHWQLQDEK